MYRPGDAWLQRVQELLGMLGNGPVGPEACHLLSRSQFDKPPGYFAVGCPTIDSRENRFIESTMISSTWRP